MIPSYSFNLTTKPPDTMVILWASAIVQHGWSIRKTDRKGKKIQKLKQKLLQYLVFK